MGGGVVRATAGVNSGHPAGPPGAGRKIRILEALSATGLRACRYWKEIPELGTVVANDFSADAVTAALGLERGEESNTRSEYTVTGSN